MPNQYKLFKRGMKIMHLNSTSGPSNTSIALAAQQNGIDMQVLQNNRTSYDELSMQGVAAILVTVECRGDDCR